MSGNLASRMRRSAALSRRDRTSASSRGKTPGRLADVNVQGAVILLTDGGDNCASEMADSEDEVVVRLEQAAASLLARDIKTYVIRFGKDTSRTPQQERELRAIVTAGGTATSDPADMSQLPYVDASDPSALQAALAEISNRPKFVQQVQVDASFIPFVIHLIIE